MPIFASWSLKKIPRNEVELEAKVKFEGYMLYRIFPHVNLCGRVEKKKKFPHVKNKTDISKQFSPDPLESRL